MGTYEQSFARTQPYSGAPIIASAARPAYMNPAAAASSAPAYPDMPEWVTDAYTADAYRRGWRMQNGMWYNPLTITPGQEAAYEALQTAITQALDEARATGNQEVYDRVRAGTDRMRETQEAAMMAPSAQGEKPLTQQERHTALRRALRFLGRGDPQLGADSHVMFSSIGGPAVGRNANYQEFMRQLETARQHFGLWEPSESTLSLPGRRGASRAWSLADLDALEKQARGIYASEEAKALRQFDALPGDRQKHFRNYQNLLSHNRALAAAKSLPSQPGPQSPQGAVAGKVAEPSFSNLPAVDEVDNTPGPKPLEYPQLSPQTTRKGLIR